jgi:hypothetical protein
MNTFTSYIYTVGLGTLMVSVAMIFHGMNIGDKMATRYIEMDAIRNGVGYYGVNRETDEVKFYWISNGTNVVAYKGGK